MIGRRVGLSGSDMLAPYRMNGDSPLQVQRIHGQVFQVDVFHDGYICAKMRNKCQKTKFLGVFHSAFPYEKRYICRNYIF